MNPFTLFFVPKVLIKFLFVSNKTKVIAPSVLALIKMSAKWVFELLGFGISAITY
jgi:hypothetical protein